MNSNQGIEVYRKFWIILILLTTPGCVVVQTGVTNPLPDATTVAIVPFFNQSMERVVDGRRIAEAYYREVQKVGFEVVPVGVTETAMIKHGINLQSPADALRLAQAMNVDMVVIGTITDYDPYYPPRVGMHVAWYSPKRLEFSPGVQVDPYARRHFKLTEEVKHQEADDFYPAETKGWNRLRKVGRVTGLSHFTRAFGSFRRGMWYFIIGTEEVPEGEIIQEGEVIQEQMPPEGEIQIRSQSPDDTPENVRANRSISVSPVLETKNVTTGGETVEIIPPNKPFPTSPDSGIMIENGQVCPEDCPECPEDDCEHHHHHREHHLVFPDLTKYPGMITAERLKPVLDFNPLEPVMSYTKIFDARDADVVANLRDYCELNGDLRSGGWKAYLERTDDYIQFVAHRMVVEMLTLHGGEGKKRFILTKRKRY